MESALSIDPPNIPAPPPKEEEEVTPGVASHTPRPAFQEVPRAPAPARRATEGEDENEDEGPPTLRLPRGESTKQ